MHLCSKCFHPKLSYSASAVPFALNCKYVIRKSIYFSSFVLCSLSQCLIDFSNVHCNSLRGSLWTVWAGMWDVSAAIMENMSRDYQVSFSDPFGNYNSWTLAQRSLTIAQSLTHICTLSSPETNFVLSSNWISNIEDENNYFYLCMH